jgi:cytosine deaminase
MQVLDNCLVPLSALDEADRKRCPAIDGTLNPAARVRITVDNGIIRSVEPYSGELAEGAEDMRGTFLTPRFLDAHVHLDKAHTWDRAPNRSGTFAEAIAVLGQDRFNWTDEDLYRRANYTLQCAWAYGTTAVRTHVDTGLPWAETSHRVMAALREEWKGRIELQTVSLCRVEDYDSAEGAAIADLPVRYGAAAIGGMPVMNPGLDRQLDALLRLAAERRVGVDLHVDESGDPEALTLLAVAEAVIRNEFPYPVTCGHCCSLAVQPPELQAKVMDRVGQAGIHIISLPLCNLYLQDRYTTESPKTTPARTPFWRGLTLINEWMDRGTVTACASDNVRDAFYAFGDLDAFEVFITSVRAAHLDNNLSRALEVVTTAPATIMDLPDQGRIAPGLPARFISFPSRSWSEWLSRPLQARRLFERGQWIEPALPDPSQLEPAVPVS